KTEPDKVPGWRMSVPLSLLCVLALVGGFIAIPVNAVFPPVSEHHPHFWVEAISIAIPVVGVGIAYLIFLGGQLSVDRLVNSSIGRTLKQFWFSHWAMDWLYDRVFVRPYYALAKVFSGEPVDGIYNLIVEINQR